MLHTGDLDFAQIVEYAKSAEKLGYEGVWLTEENGKEVFSVLALLAAQTSRISLNTGIVNFYSRSPMTLAMGASTIQRMSGGRLHGFGLGTGGIGFMVRGHGIPIERPVARAREVRDIVRAYLTQPRFSYQGQWFNVQDFHLREGPLPDPPRLYLAALGPQMVRIAARCYDGFIMNWPTPQAIAAYRDIVAREASAVGRDPEAVRTLTLLQVVAEPEDADSVEAMRRGLAFYCASEHYLRIADLSGLGEQARRVKEVWETRDYKAAASLVTDEMVAAFSLWGSREACRERLRSMLAQGVYPIVYPVPRPGRAPEDYLRTLDLVASYLAD